MPAGPAASEGGLRQRTKAVAKASASSGESGLNAAAAWVAVGLLLRGGRRVPTGPFHCPLLSHSRPADSDADVDTPHAVAGFQLWLVIVIAILMFLLGRMSAA